MHCVDCHFAQDSHGNGHLYGEVAQAVEIDCKDCHGTVNAYPTLRTSGPAAGPNGTDLSVMRNPDGRRRFEWLNGKLIQRSVLDPKREWEVSLDKDSVTPTSPGYNEKAGRAKLMSRDTKNLTWGSKVAPADLAANSLQFVRDQATALRALVAQLRQGDRFILVEYDAEHGNPWVPHPISFARWQRLAPEAGLTGVRLLHRVPSSFLGSIYSSAADRAEAP